MLIYDNVYSSQSSKSELFSGSDHGLPCFPSDNMINTFIKHKMLNFIGDSKHTELYCSVEFLEPYIISECQLLTVEIFEDIADG